MRGSNDPKVDVTPERGFDQIATSMIGAENFDLNLVGGVLLPLPGFWTTRMARQRAAGASSILPVFPRIFPCHASPRMRRRQGRRVESDA